MKHKTRRIVGAVVVIGALAAGGAAFTASNTLPTTDIAGVGSVTVTGATVSSIHNVQSADGQDIASVQLVFSTSQAGNTVTGEFSDETAADSCTDTNAGTDTNWTCTITHGTGTGSDLSLEPITGANSYSVTVTQ